VDEVDGVDIEYGNYVGFDPTSVSWSHDGRRILLEFPFTVRAVYSGPLRRVVAELFQIRKLRFYDLDGSVDGERDIPELPGYQFWGLNPNSGSRSGIALLFQPVDEGVGNEWRDAEQYELVPESESQSMVGRRLGIFR
jgi:hypothetical protein